MMTLIYQPEAPDHAPQTKMISIHHANCFNDMIEAFTDPETLTRPLTVRRLLPDNSETWKAIGQIFLKGYQDCHYLPIKLAPPFVEEMLFGAVYSDLTEVFLQFVSCQE